MSVQQLVASKGEQDQQVPFLMDQLPAHLHARIHHPLTVLRSFGVSRMPEQEILPEVEVQTYQAL